MKRWLLLGAWLLACTDSGVIGQTRTMRDAATPPPIEDAGAEPLPGCPGADASCQTCVGDDDCAGGECDDGRCRPEEEEEEEEENAAADDNSGPGGGD